MKRYGFLFEKILSFDNLLIAARKAFRRKKHREIVMEFYFNLEKELVAIQEDLLSGTYKLRPYSIFNVYEPKERKICASDFRDRVLHHAICNIIEPLIEKSLIYDTYACRKDKGTHRAIRRVQQFSRKHEYFLKCDIKKFFENIDHFILKELLINKFKDCKLLDLLDEIIDSPVEGYEEGKGLPIGNLTSQIFANFYLSQLDHFIKDELSVKGYVRYMDDFIIFGENKSFLHDILLKTGDFLRDNLFLSIKKEVLSLAPVRDGIPFLGFRIFPYLIRLDGVRKKRFNRKVKGLLKKYENGYVDEDFFISSLSGMTAHILHSNSLVMRRHVFI